MRIFLLVCVGIEAVIAYDTFKTAFKWTGEGFWGYGVDNAFSALWVAIGVALSVILWGIFIAVCCASRIIKHFRK